MDISLINALAEIMDKTGLTGMEISEGNTKIKLEKNIVHTVVTQSAPAPSTKPAANANAPAVSEDVVDFNKIIEVKSPLVGVFYSAPSKDAAPYVKVGDKVKKGDVLCLIEAMKLINEITAENDGEIVDICVQNGQVVEFSQILFKIF